MHTRVHVENLTDRFDIVRVLGKGTAGTVYHVKDRLWNNRDLALKILSSKLAVESTATTRFVEELKICSSIKHRNIVQAYELIECRDCIGYTMELINGCDLRQLLSSSTFTYPEIDQVMYQLLEGLTELHRLKIMHRDIKLENLILTEDGVLKISDLGLVQKLETKHGGNSGVLLGTPQYMPPEYVKSTWYDERSDIYACGIVLLELLTGKRRLPNKGASASIKHLITTNFELPRISIPKEHHKYYDILKFSLARSPDSRFQTAKEMQEAFEKIDPTPTIAMTQKIKLSRDRKKRKGKVRLYFLMTILIIAIEVLRAYT